jgi:hypothetical protein
VGFPSGAKKNCWDVTDADPVLSKTTVVSQLLSVRIRGRTLLCKTDAALEAESLLKDPSGASLILMARGSAFGAGV